MSDAWNDSLRCLPESWLDRLVGPTIFLMRFGAAGSDEAEGRAAAAAAVSWLEHELDATIQAGEICLASRGSGSLSRIYRRHADGSLRLAAEVAWRCRQSLPMYTAAAVEAVLGVCRPLKVDGRLAMSITAEAEAACLRETENYPGMDAREARRIASLMGEAVALAGAAYNGRPTGKRGASPAQSDVDRLRGLLAALRGARDADARSPRAVLASLLEDVPDARAAYLAMQVVPRSPDKPPSPAMPSSVAVDATRPVAAEAPDEAAAIKLPPKPKGRRVARLDDMATALYMDNPSLTFAQLAAMLECDSSTLRNKYRCPKLAAARETIREGRLDFSKADEWKDRAGG